MEKEPLPESRKELEKALRECRERFLALTSLSSDWFWEQDEHYRFTLFSGYLQEKTVLGSKLQLGMQRWDTPALIGKHRWDTPAENMTAEDWERHREVLERHEPFYDLEIKRLDAEGRAVWTSVSGKPIFSDDGRFKGYLGVGRDITAGKHAESELRRFRTAVDATADGIHIIDCETMRFVDVNDTACRMVGYTREEFLRLSITDLAPVGMSLEQLRDSYERLFSGEDAVQRAEVVNRHKDGTVIPMEIHRRGVVIDGRRFVANVVRDIRQRKIDEARLKESEARFRALTDLSADWYWEQDENLRLAARTGGKTEGVGLRPHSDIGKLRWELPILGVSDAQWDEHKALLAARKPFRDFEYYREYPEGRRYVSITGEPILDEQGRFTGYRGVGRNITDRKQSEERIQFLAYHDGLTKLPNRANFSMVLNHALQQSRRHSRKFAVMFIDLDRFKSINDTLGHDAGDVLLCEIARRLKESLRASDTVARLGGDEFVVLVEDVAEATYVATVARKILAAVIRPVTLRGQEYSITASVGICVYSADASDEQSLMKNADIAMYRAKEQGKNTFQFYSEEINVHSFERLALETSLRRALERDEFFLHYQAKLDLNSGRITGVEALLRWQHPDLGLVAPAQFIPLAEETGLIVPIGLWVLKTACAQNAAWQSAGLPPVCIAVNLSLRQFNDDNLLKHIADSLQESGMQAELLELELTEGMVMQNAERAGKVLAAIKKLGVRIAIDDFGVGYSSLANLKRFPIDILKVDRSFIRDLSQSAEDRAITEAIIAMGKTLSLTVVAEGVETQEQQTFLRNHSCDEMQGYFFSKPVLAAEFADLMKRQK